MRPRRTAASLAAVAILVSACGAGSDEGEPEATQATAPLEQTAPVATDDAGTVDDDATPDTAATAETPVDPAADGETDTASDDGTEATTETTTEPTADDTGAAAGDAGDQSAPTTDAPPAEAAPEEPEPAPLGGRAFAPMVAPASDFEGNPLPDIVVNDVGRDQDANIRNIFPSDRPVLLWTWAPH